MDVAPLSRTGHWALRSTGALVALGLVALVDSARAEQTREGLVEDPEADTEGVTALWPSSEDDEAFGEAAAPRTRDCDTSWGCDDESLVTPVPTEWAPSHGRQCHRYKGRRVCEGPRKVPLPHGEAAELARALGLGARRTVSVLQRERPPTEWIEALGAEDGGDAPLCWPVDGGVLWRRFGAVRHHGRRRFHRGIDVGAPAGALIRSVRRGLVAYSDNGIQGYGNILLIVHADESVAWYAHCQATYVFAGQVVRRGQVIGEVGATGIAQGAHLHFEMRREGRAFDPLPLFDSPPIAPRASR